MKAHLTTILVAAAALLLPMTAMSTSTMANANSVASICTNLPQATDGNLVLDRHSVRPGQSVLAVLSGFYQWPQAYIGGGSGETFLSCTPWVYERPEVMVHDAAGLFLVNVPSSAKPGTYSIYVAFAQGSTSAGMPPAGSLRRLAVTLTVSKTAPITASSRACQLRHVAAPAGHLNAQWSETSDPVIAASIAGVPASRLGILNWIDQLRYVGCIDGQALPVTRLANGTAQFLLNPLGVAPRPHVVTLIGVLDQKVVQWSHTVITPAPEVPTCSTRVPLATTGRLTLDRTSVRPGEDALAIVSNLTPWPARMIGGGSGENLVYCAPWMPYAQVATMTHDSAPGCS